MFTITQIQQAHSQVRSGADFPAYIQAIKALGVIHYETFVADGHTDYYGANDFQATSPAKYAALPIADQANTAQLTADLKAHQQGQSDYPTFIDACARLGIERWVVDLGKMTCTYYDKAQHVILTEVIPQ